MNDATATTTSDVCLPRALQRAASFAHVACRVLRLAVVSVLLATMASCTSTSGVGDPSTATGGVRLEVESRDTESQLMALYVVSPNGTLDWGGGRNAMQGTTTWQGTLTAEQIAALRTLLEEDGWFDGRPKGSGTPRSKVGRVMLRSDRGNRRYELRGECPAFDRLVALLESAARGRHEAHLNTLPVAGDRMR